MAGVSASELFKALDTGEYSDFTINCRGFEFKVHRVVVCSASPMIRAALDRPFKIFNSLEPDGREIQPEVKFSSTGGSGAANIDKLEDLEPLKLHVLVYKYADMLGIENLKALAATRFLKESETALKEESFAQQLKAVYDSTAPNDQPLRLAVTSLCIKNHEQLPAEVIKVVQMNEPNVWAVALPFLNEAPCLVEQAKKAVVDKINPEILNTCHGVPPKKFSVSDSGEIYRHCGSGRTSCKRLL